MGMSNEERRSTILKWWEDFQNTVIVRGVCPILTGSYSFGANHELSDLQCAYVVDKDDCSKEFAEDVAKKMQEVLGGQERKVGTTKAGLWWISGEKLDVEGVHLWKFDATVRSHEQHEIVMNGIRAWLEQSKEEREAYIEKSKELTETYKAIRESFGPASDEFKQAIQEKATHMVLLKTLPQ